MINSTIKEKKTKEKVKMAETLVRVHTHTHTQGDLKNRNKANQIFAFHKVCLKDE